jgi:hypothetical protein
MDGSVKVGGLPFLQESRDKKGMTTERTRVGLHNGKVRTVWVRGGGGRREEGEGGRREGEKGRREEGGGRVVLHLSAGHCLMI